MIRHGRASHAGQSTQSHLVCVVQCPEVRASPDVWSTSKKAHLGSMWSSCKHLACSQDAYRAAQGKQSRSQFSNWLCYEATSTCKSKPPPLPKDRKPGPAFEVGDPQEMQMAKMMDSMKVRLSLTCAQRTHAWLGKSDIAAKSLQSHWS